jgi:UDP-N-acetylglucosamine 4,6-dehydratase
VSQTLVITGGTGFLGKRLALALRDRYDVVLTGRNNKQNMLAEQFSGCRVLPMDVASIEAVRDVFTEIRPGVVIHAAATKFVDLAERQPMECVDVNVVGSQNVARVSVEKGVHAVIGVSTDKAAPPVRNTYGLSKAIMERLFCAMDGKTDTRFACARYGNVAWSTGSVLPLWNKMHQTTGVIRTTGPEMRRFFFTVDEAVQLIVTLLGNIERHRGEVVSRQMRSALIRDILELWVARKGGRWERMEGRPGERDDEFLVGELELPHAYEVVYDDVPHYAIAFNRRSERPLKEALSSANAARLTKEQIVELIENPPPEER